MYKHLPGPDGGVERVLWVLAAVVRVVMDWEVLVTVRFGLAVGL